MYYDRLKSRVRASNAARRRQQEAKALIDCIDVKQHIAPVYYPLHEDVKAGRHSTYNLPGGRGSCKSSFVSVEIVSGIMQDGESNAIVFRAVGNTLRDSCYSQIGCGNSNEVKLCTCTGCALYPYREGHNPFIQKQEWTEERKAAQKARMAQNIHSPIREKSAN